MQFPLTFQIQQFNTLSLLPSNNNKNRFELQKMVWYMNFCMPFLSDDSAINFNRYIMAAELVLLLVFYTALKVIASCQGVNPDSASSNAVKDHSDESEHSHQIDEKASAVGKDEKLSDPEDMHSSKMKTSYGGSNTGGDAFKKVHITCLNRRIDMAEVQTMFPIFFGHHAVAVASSILYTPYMYQSGASLLYFLLTIPLLFTHASQSYKILTAIWTIMMLLNVALMMSGLIGVGIANWDTLSSMCYGQELS